MHQCFEYAFALISLTLFLPLFILILESSIGGTNTTTTTIAHNKPIQLVMKLIHRDSVLSPYYNSDSAVSELLGRAKKSSMARSAYLNARARSSSNVWGHSMPDKLGGIFLVNFSIGHPPIPQLAIIDTGSDLLWIQCRPCEKCFDQLSPVFDPAESSTYRRLPCTSPYCVFSHVKCDNSSSTCTYQRSYADDTASRGIIGTEELRFMTSDEGTTIIPNIVFGCGLNNSGLTNTLASGVLGLNQHKFSLVSQIGSKFSYCFGSILDRHYEYNQLIIGDGAKTEGYSTPIEVFDNQYYLTLEGISVGEKRLNINRDIFRRDGRSGNAGVIIDSGTTVTYLERGGFKTLKFEVESLISGLLAKVVFQDEPDTLCYRGRVNQDLKGFPVVTFHFAGGADLVLDMDALFLQHGGGVFCMAVEPAEDRGLTIIGIMAQQYYNVAYDLDAMKLYLRRIDCQLLED